MLNGMLTAANAGTMPVVGMPSTLHPVSPMWHAATSKTRLPFFGRASAAGNVQRRRSRDALLGKSSLLLRSASDGGSMNGYIPIFDERNC